METDDGGTITRLLQQWNRGVPDAPDRVISRLYDELHRIAAHYFHVEREGHTLQPTAVVNEALLQLLQNDHLQWRNGAQFIGIAARTMRRILVDHARKRQSQKRWGRQLRVPLEKVVLQSGMDDPALVALDDALEGLSAFDRQKAQIVELRFFAGLTGAEIARYLEVSEATVNRQYRRAKAWLYSELEGDSHGEPGTLAGD